MFFWCLVLDAPKQNQGAIFSIMTKNSLENTCRLELKSGFELIIGMSLLLVQ